MDGFPPTRESQVTFQNYREYPYSQWSFRNAGAPFHILMVPRSGKVHEFGTAPESGIGSVFIKDSAGNNKTFEDVFRDNYASGVIVLRNDTILYEQYWNGLSRDYQHVWFSMTKSLTSAALGILVEQERLDLAASPSRYIPELKNTPYDRATIQDVLNMSTALGFKENYTDTSYIYWKEYGAARDQYFVKGARDVDPNTTEVYGVYDFLAKSVTPNPGLNPGDVFEYNSSNGDLIGWLISKVSGQTYTDFIREQIWAKMGAEHDATLAVDRAYMGVATMGMNTTLRDAALFGEMIRNGGKVDGKKIVPSDWVDQILHITEADKKRYSRNEVYAKAGMPWIAYKNFWWILDDKKGEFAAIGTNGQVIYINRRVQLVIAYFSCQPGASSAGNQHFLAKLHACRMLSKRFTE